MRNKMNKSALMSKGKRRFSAPAAVLAVILVAALVVGGCAVGLLLSYRYTPDSLSAAQPDTRAAVGSEQFTDSHPVKVSFDIVPDSPLTWKGSGTVTSSAFKDFGAIDSGSTVFSVDDVPVLALFSSLPFYRDLRVGDKGNDVAALRAELSRLGYAVGSYAPTVFDASLRAALLQLQRKIGVADPQGNLDIRYLVWLPAQQVQVVGWKPSPGVEASADLGSVKGALSAVRIQKMPGGVASDGHVVQVYGKQGPIDSEGVSRDTAFLAAVASTPGYAAISANKDALNAGADAELLLQKPVQAMKIPVGAVFALQGNSACVQSGNEVRSITVMGSNGGFVMAASDKPISSVNLGTAITAKSCPVRQVKQ